MRKQFIALAAAVALSMPLMACSTGDGTSSSTSSSTGGTSTEQGVASGDVAEFYAGTWRASVETSGNTVYGNVAGKEYMLDLVLEEDGTATVTPLEGHEDLLGGEGAWSAADETAVTVTLDSATIEITVIDDATLECDPTAFGIEGFEVLTFEYY